MEFLKGGTLLYYILCTAASHKIKLTNMISLSYSNNSEFTISAQTSMIVYPCNLVTNPYYYRICRTAPLLPVFFFRNLDLTCRSLEPELLPTNVTLMAAER